AVMPRTTDDPAGVGEPTRRGQPTATTRPARTMTVISASRSPLPAAPARARAVTTVPTTTRGRGRVVGAAGSSAAARWPRRADLGCCSEGAEDVTRGGYRDRPAYSGGDGPTPPPHGR